MWYLLVCFVILSGAGCGSGSTSTLTLLHTCASNNGVDCKETYKDETVSNYVGGCAGNETVVSGTCPTTNAIGKCSRATASGGVHTDYYYYNALQPNQANCSSLGGTYSSLP